MLLEFPHRVVNADGTRLCSFGCGRSIEVCNGSVVAGDLILFIRGQIAADQIRERCGHCATRHVMQREGYMGHWVKLKCWFADRKRWFEWQYQKRKLPVLYSPQMNI